jgi:hypothetical protein
MKQSEKIIYLKETDIPLTHNRKQLIRYFLRGKSIPTYDNKECTKLQCDGKGKDNGVTAFRSITDIHMIVKSRFPKTSIEGVVKILDEFIKEDQAVVLVWCKMINKVVVKYYNNPNASYITRYSRDGYIDTEGVDGYSLRDYDKMRKDIKK